MVAPPTVGIPHGQILPGELNTHFYYPNFLRPFPQEEEESLEPLWLIPGILPEPYWDFNMGLQFNLASIKKHMNKALKTNLTSDEQKTLQKGLETDPELVFHIGLTP